MAVGDRAAMLAGLLTAARATLVALKARYGAPRHGVTWLMSLADGDAFVYPPARPNLRSVTSPCPSYSRVLPSGGTDVSEIAYEADARWMFGRWRAS
jgi:hypothetical protein